MTRLWAPSDLISPPTIEPAFGAWTTTDQAVRMQLVAAKGQSPIARGGEIKTAASGSAAGSKGLDRQLISFPMPAGVVIDGTVKGQLMVREDQTADNVDQILIAIKVVSLDGKIVRAILLALGSYGTTAEFTTNDTHRNAFLANGDAISSYTTVLGDRIVVEVGYSNSTIADSAAIASGKWGEDAADLPENETQTTPDGAPWIEFSATLTFLQEPGFAPAQPLAPQLRMVA